MGDQVGETSSSIILVRIRVAHDIQLNGFSKNGSSDIICNADKNIGEIRSFADCKTKVKA